MHLAAACGYVRSRSSGRLAGPQVCERFVAAKLGLRVVRARRVDDVDVGNSGFESLVVASA